MPVTITTGARLHFGLIVAGEPDRRSYGGVGLMIDQPGFSLTVRRANQDRILAAPDVAARLAEFLAHLRDTAASDCWEIEVHHEIPAHAGLGSGTQLGLAVAAAVSRLRGEIDISIAELARRVGRSARSIIGTVGFESGGLIAHGMLAEGGSLSSNAIRCDFPADWRFVLVTPRDYVGLYGEAERQAFRELPPLSETTLRVLIRLQTLVMNSAAASDFGEFNDALCEFAHRIGEYFTPIQRGVFADWRMSELARHVDSFVSDIYLEKTCLGQTSWGPTLFVACRSAKDAREVEQSVREYARSRVIPWDNLEVRIVAARNQGADFDRGSA